MNERDGSSGALAGPRHLTRLTLLGLAAAALSVGVSATASASTGSTEPADETTDTSATDATMADMDMAATTEHTEHTMAGPAASLAVDGSAEPSSPEVATFCDAAIAAEAAFLSEDPALIGPAVEALTAAAPAEMAATVDVIAADDGSFTPEVEVAYAELITFLKANCGFAEIDVAGGEYYFGGIPAEVPAGPAIITLVNEGVELHVIELYRVNDDVTLTTDELLALPEEEALSMVTSVGSAFAAPGGEGYGIADLTAGRYLAVCPIPQGLTPEIAAQFEEGPPGSAPEGSAPAATEPAGTEAAAETMPAATEPAGTMPAGSEPTGSGPGGPELGPPHFVLGMVHDFTVV